MRALAGSETIRNYRSIFSRISQFIHTIPTFVSDLEKLFKDTINCPDEKAMKASHFSIPNGAFYLCYDKILLLFSRPISDKDTYAVREFFHYSSLAEKPFDQWEIAIHWRPFQILMIVTLI